MWQKVNFKQISTDLNSEFYYSLIDCYTRVKEPNLPFYLPVASRRIVGFDPAFQALHILQTERTYKSSIIDIENYLIILQNLIHH